MGIYCDDCQVKIAIVGRIPENMSKIASFQWRSKMEGRLLSVVEQIKEITKKPKERTEQI